jgi:hypothetical protein
MLFFGAEDRIAKIIQEIKAIEARMGGFYRKENKERDLIPWQTY